MKRKNVCIFILLAWSTYCPSSFAQGSLVTFNFSNFPAVDAPVFDSSGNRLFGSNFLAVLYGGSTMDSLTPAVEISFGPYRVADPAPLTRIHNGQPGYFFGGGVGVVLQDCGPFAWLQVRVWDIQLGGSYDEVAGLGMGGYGASSIFQARGGLYTCITLPEPPQPLYGLQSFILVPEPSMWGLLGVGGLVVCWAARRHRPPKP